MLACLCVSVCVDWLVIRSVIAAVSLWLDSWLRRCLSVLFGHKMDKKLAWISRSKSATSSPLSVPGSLNSCQPTLCCVNKETEMSAETMSVVIYSYSEGHFWQNEAVIASLNQFRAVWWNMRGYCSPVFRMILQCCLLCNFVGSINLEI